MDQQSALDFITAAQVGNCCIHVLSRTPDPQMAHICLATSGSFKLISSKQTIEEDIQQLYSSLKIRYSISFSVAIIDKTSSGPLSLQVYTASGLGKCTIVRHNQRIKPAGSKWISNS